MAENEKDVLKLTPLMDAGCVLIFKGRRGKQEVLRALAKKIAESGEYGEPDDIEWGIFHREELMSTGIGGNIALPHLAVPDVRKPRIAVAVCRDGIPDYQSPDSLPVQLVFMIITGKDQAVSHLKILASVSAMFYDGRLKAAFLAANDPGTCMKIVEKAESL